MAEIIELAPYIHKRIAAKLDRDLANLTRKPQPKSYLQSKIHVPGPKGWAEDLITKWIKHLEKIKEDGIKDLPV